MIYLSIFLSVTAISICIITLFKFKSLKKERIEKEIKDDYIVMPKLKEMPYYHDVDPSNKTLYEVIQSMNIEDWKLEHYSDTSSLGDIVYEFSFSNPQNTLKVNSRMRYYSDFGGTKRTNDLVLIGFHVGHVGTVKGIISYKENENSKHLSLSLIHI